jgi:hypothetical protein
VKDEEGQVGIIGALLLIGVALILVSYVVTYTLPEMTRDAEKSHLHEVERSFSDIHQSIASQIASGAVGTIYPSSFPVGRQGSLFGLGSITGTLSIGQQVFYVNSTSSLVANSSIVYEPVVSQTIPQIYSYEMGGVIRSQGDRSLMKFDPIITIDRDTSTLTLNMTMISLTTMQITSRAGTGSLTINFFIDYIMPVSFYKEGQSTGSIVFDFNTPNAGAWRKYFQERMEPVGREFYSIDSELNSQNRFHMTLKNVDLENSKITYAIVRVSIGG